MLSICAVSAASITSYLADAELYTPTGIAAMATAITSLVVAITALVKAVRGDARNGSVEPNGSGHLDH